MSKKSLNRTFPPLDAATIAVILNDENAVNSANRLRRLPPKRRATDQLGLNFVFFTKFLRRQEAFSRIPYTLAPSTARLRRTTMDVFQMIANALADRYGLDASEITPETELIAIGVDSLDAAELLMALEEKIGVEIEPTKKLATIQDVVATVEAAQNESF